MATMDDDAFLERLDADDFSGFSSQTPTAYPLSVHDVVIGTAYGLDNVARFYRFATAPAMLDSFRRLKRTYAISDPPLSTRCQSSSPDDERAIDYDEEMAW